MAIPLVLAPLDAQPARVYVVYARDAGVAERSLALCESPHDADEGDVAPLHLGRHARAIEEAVVVERVMHLGGGVTFGTLDLGRNGEIVVDGPHPRNPLEDLR